MIWAAIFRLVVVAAAVIGMVYTWIALDSPLNPLVLFTVQSNLLLAGYYFWRVVSRRPASAEVKGAVTLYIVITGLVWHFCAWAEQARSSGCRSPASAWATSCSTT
ncbi:hypothetical protein [Acrocarpospora sp. B8E8]|uniref:hypothetical protein n=1 Tax=Acrocarpospora sp. B8E8 TaxID=3153572 RepID=UPI00325CA5B2